MFNVYSKSKLMLMLYNNLALSLYSEGNGRSEILQSLSAMATLVASPDFPKFVKAQQLIPNAQLFEHSIFDKEGE